MKFRFGECELDLSAQVLSVNDVKVEVEPQVFDLLVFFTKNQGRLITPDEMVTNVWRGRIVSDSAIAAKISLARKAVGDNGKSQHIIRTVPRRGYRFLPAVHTAENQNSAPMTGADDGSSHQVIRFCHSADGTRIAFATSGTGPPLVRTGHWLTHLEHDWKNPIWRPFLDEMGKRFTVIRYDQRGCGLSDWDVSDFSFQRFCEDLDAVIEASGHERVVMYATSQGVPVAIDYATRYPHRVSHLVCLGGYVTGRLLRQSTEAVEQGKALIKLMEYGWGVEGSPFIKAFTLLYIPGATMEQTDSMAALQKLSTTAENAVSIRCSVDNFDVTHLLGEVTVKTLVLHAANDAIHPLDQGRTLAAGISGSEFIQLASDNHALLPQEPAWRRFFDELDRFTGS